MIEHATATGLAVWSEQRSAGWAVGRSDTFEVLSDSIERWKGATAGSPTGFCIE